MLKDPVRIALVSDTHLSCDSDGTGPLYLQRLERVIGAVNAARPDLVLFGGDLTDHELPQEVELAMQQMGRFTVPVRFVAGKHDVGEKLSAHSKSPVDEARLAAYEARIGPAFYMERLKTVRVIGVTGSLFGSGLSIEAAQWAFLENELSAPSPEPTLLLTHYPPFVHSSDEPSDQWNIDLAQRARLLAMLRQGGVCAVLSGHTHHPRSFNYEGIQLITTFAVAFGLPYDQQPEGWMLLTMSNLDELDIVNCEI